MVTTAACTLMAALLGKCSKGRNGCGSSDAATKYDDEVTAGGATDEAAAATTLASPEAFAPMAGAAPINVATSSHRANSATKEPFDTAAEATGIPTDTAAPWAGWIMATLPFAIAPLISLRLFYATNQPKTLGSMA
ncbi:MULTISPECIES: hypothetical protein [unclassified Dyella]|uniref:hypothetical protein n=1 Tax=unclassified Dyella TaxID=2634549 RepID=UPI003F91E1D0